MLMNWDYECKVVQSIVPLSNRQFLIEGSLEGNMCYIQGLFAEVNFWPLFYVFLLGFGISMSLDFH